MKACLKWVLVAGLFLPAAAGCGGSREFSHDEVEKLFIAALDARAVDEAKCVELMTQVIEQRPMDAAYFHRGWIYAKQGKTDEAQADVAAGLELEPENGDLKWLDGELKKPVGKRSLVMPPSTRK